MSIMNRGEIYNFTTNIINEAKRTLAGKGIMLDQDIEADIKVAIVNEIKEWHSMPKEDKETTGTIKRKAFEMFSKGIDKKSVKDELKIHKSTADKYYRNWRQENQIESHPEDWYREKYPGFHDAFYVALAKGIISTNIIKQNRI